MQNNKPTHTSTAAYAKRYIERFGLCIVPIEPSRKFPRAKDWGKNTISDPIAAFDFYTQNPDWNLGVSLADSQMCALDIDCLESFSIICEVFGRDLTQLIKDTPTIVGNPIGRRLEFRVPIGMDLPYVKLNWRPKSDPTGVIYRENQRLIREARANNNNALADELTETNKQYAPYTVFELRSSTDGKQRQNVYPPSIHPETNQPYKWLTQPKDDWPTPPDWLLTIWQEFDKFKPQLLAACPWAVVDEIYKPSKKSSPPKLNNATGWRQVVDTYNHANHIESQLQQYGYKRIGKRWLSPNSSTNLPGVVILDDTKCWVHHASDALCSGESGQPVSSFDLYVYNEHQGDYSAAIKKAAKDYNVTSAPVYHQSSNTATAAEINPETGEVTPLSTDYISPLPWLNNNAKPLAVIENLQEIINRINYTVRYNVIKKRQEILIPNASFSMDNADNASFARLVDECVKFSYPTEKIPDYLTVVSDANQYNPVMTWINSKPWDGADRLTALLGTILTNGDIDLKNTLMTKWLIQAVAAAASSDGISARGVLTLQGGQGLGKTRWFKRLVPAFLDATLEGALLRPDDKDSVAQIIAHWLVELGELDATFKRAEIAQLKGFITKSHDIIRLPYARKESRFPRRTVFFASVNPREFLNDPTGNSRFWTIECTHIDHNHEIDMQQLWAQIYDMYQNGATYVLTPEEDKALADGNAEYVAVDPTIEMLEKWLDWSAPVEQWQWKQTTNILIECGVDRPTRADTTKAAMYIREHNKGQSQRNSKGQRVLKVPPKRPQSY